MRPVYRWVTAILMAIALLGVFIPFYYPGFFLGGMATELVFQPARHSLPVAGGGLAGRAAGNRPGSARADHPAGALALGLDQPGGRPDHERLLLYQLVPLFVVGV